MEEHGTRRFETHAKQVVKEVFGPALEELKSIYLKVYLEDVREVMEEDVQIN